MVRFVIVWQYDINPAARAAFEQAYAPDGAWASLFRASPEYIETQILRDLSRPDRYMTCDYWRSAEAFESFKAAQHTAYAALDRECARLTIAEVHLGSFYTAESN